MLTLNRAIRATCRIACIGTLLMNLDQIVRDLKSERDRLHAWPIPSTPLGVSSFASFAKGWISRNRTPIFLDAHPTERG